MKTIRHIQSNKTRPITKVPFEQMRFQVSLGWEKCVKLWRAENPKAEVHSTRSNRIGCLDRNDDFNRILLRHQNTTILWSASGYNIKSNLFIFPKGFIYNLLGNDLVLHGWIISNTMYHWDLALLHTHIHKIILYAERVSKSEGHQKQGYSSYSCFRLQA